MTDTNTTPDVTTMTRGQAYRAAREIRESVQLGAAQHACLESLIRSGPTGWYWVNRSKTIRTMRSLERRGLVVIRDAEAFDWRPTDLGVIVGDGKWARVDSALERHLNVKIV